MFTRVEPHGKEARQHLQQRGCSRSAPAPPEPPEQWRYVEGVSLGGVYTAHDGNMIQLKSSIPSVEVELGPGHRFRAPLL